MPDLTESDRLALRDQLDWSEDRDFQVDPVRGPVPGEPEKSGRWIVVVRIGAAPAGGGAALFEVRVREDSKGYFFIDTGRRGKDARPYCGTKNVNEAIEQAEHFLEGQRATAGAGSGQLAQVASEPEGATFGQLLSLFPRLDASKVATSGKYELAARVAVAVFGANTPIKSIGRKRLRDAIARRQEGIPALGLGSVKLVTAEATLRNVVTLIGHLNRLTEDPDEKLVPRCYLNSRDIDWPNAEKERRPPAKTAAFGLLMLPFTYVDKDGNEETLGPPVDVVDPTGRLRLFLAIAFYLGRRFSSILNLYWADVKRGIWEVRSALDDGDLSTRDWAAHFPNGVIDFKREFDKEDNWFVAPICNALNREIELYASRCGNPTGPIFPGTQNPSRPCAGSVLRASPHRKKKEDSTEWLSRYVRVGLYEEAVMLAARYLERADQDPGAVLPVEPLRPKDDKFDLLKVDPVRFKWWILHGMKLHRWRSNFATRMEDLDWGKARDADGNEGGALDGYPSFLASWVPNDGSVRSKRYVDLNPELLWLCANGVPGWEARPKVARSVVEETEAIEDRLASYSEGLLE